jgi:hypothetical protein
MSKVSSKLFKSRIDLAQGPMLGGRALGAGS